MRAPNASAIARVAYEATRAYASVLGQTSRPDWPQASPQQREAALRGVGAVLSGEARSGAHLHDLWTRHASGLPPRGPWAKGYDQLPLFERRQILLFRAAVLAVVDGPCSGYCHDQSCPVLDDHDCHLDVCVSRFGVPPGFWRSLLAVGVGGGEGGPDAHGVAALKLLS